MFTHLELSVRDLERTAPMYAAALREVGLEPRETGRWEGLSLVERPVASRAVHVAWLAPSPEAVDAFWRAGRDAGLEDDGAPGPRPEYRDDYYGAFLRDRDGLSIEAVHHGMAREPGRVDHVWLRVPDLGAVREAHVRLAARAGLEVGVDEPDLLRVRGAAGSYTVVEGDEAARHVHATFDTGLGADLAAPDASAPRLWTIGYERLLPDELVAELEAAGVLRLLDVRQRPQSRRAGMSKTRLADRLAESGIAYESRRTLGTPPDIRWLFKHGRTGEARDVFAAHLEGTAATELDELAAALDSAPPTALLCLEADAAICHRRVVCEALQRRRPGLVVVDL